LSRASEFGRLELSQVREVEEVERSAEIELSHLVSRLGQPERLALFDMDGTLLRGRFVEALARRVNRLEQLGSFLDNPSLTFDERTEGIASLFERVDKKVFEDVARSIPLMDGARETIIWLRKNGYRVGIVSDSFLVATEIVRRRVFADFSVAHMMMFRSGSATGRIRFSPAMLHENGCTMHACCKFNSVLHLSDQLRIPRSEILAVGDGPPDCCLFRGAGVSVAFQPKDSKVAEAADFVIHGSLSELREIIEKSPFRPQCA
jgi:HAD superfamily phosphoserine phosphatase-like hydrolase